MQNKRSKGHQIPSDEGCTALIETIQATDKDENTSYRWLPEISNL